MYLAALLIGVVAGLRAMTAPAAVSWAARLGWLSLQATPLAWLGAAVTPWILTAAALGEIVNDKVTTGSRKAPPSFIARIVMGALSGAAIGASGGGGGAALAVGLVLGAAGAVAGTLGGSALRARLARAIGRDLPAALLEDAVAILLAIASVRLA